MDNNLTRKDFLLKSSKAAVGITAIAGATSLITTATAAFVNYIITRFAAYEWCSVC